MWRVLVVVLACLAVPAAALARSGDRGERPLSVSNVSGKVVLTENGSVLGQVDTGGKLVVVDNLDPAAAPRDPADLYVSGYETKTVLEDGSTVYRGDDMRFRIVGGWFQVTVSGTGIDIAAVGRGTAQLTGWDGRYAVNGLPYRPVTYATAEVRFGRFASPQPTPGASGQPTPGASGQSEPGASGKLEPGR